MEEIAHLLLYKLCQKGLTTVEIPRLVKDVLNIVADSGDNTSATINQKLKTLGWGEAIVDQFTLELIIAILENERENEMATAPHGEIKDGLFTSLTNGH